MIIKTRARRTGRLIRHLESTTAGNERVLIRRDLGGDPTNSLALSLKMIVALSRTSRRTKRELVHIIISPTHGMTDKELLETLASIEKEYGIPPGTLRVIVQHTKDNRPDHFQTGGRPDHFHVVYPMIDFETGRAFRVWRSYERDEKICRVLEHRFGEPITASIRSKRVAQLLRADGEIAAAEAVEAAASAVPGQNLSTPRRQQADRLGVDARTFDARASEMWARCGYDLGTFEAQIAAEDMYVAHGDRVLVLVDGRSADSIPLARFLRKTAKAAGAAGRVREADIAQRFTDAPPLNDIRRAIVAKLVVSGRQRVDDELRHFAGEAEGDGDANVALKASNALEAIRSTRQRGQDERITAMIELVKRLRRRERRIRRARVLRVLERAVVQSDPQLRRTALIATEMQAAVTTINVALYLLMAGISLPSLRQSARRRALQERAEIWQQARMSTKARALMLALQAIPRLMGGAVDQISGSISNATPTILEGVFVGLQIAKLDGNSSDPALEQTLAALIGQNRTAVLRDLVRQGDGRLALEIADAFDPDDLDHRRQLAEILAIKGFTDIAESIEAADGRIIPVASIRSAPIETSKRPGRKAKVFSKQILAGMEGPGRLGRSLAGQAADRLAAGVKTVVAEENSGANVTADNPTRLIRRPGAKSSSKHCDRGR